MWVYYAIGAGILFTFSTLLNRRILKAGNDPWILSFYFSAIGAVITLPFMIGHLHMPSIWSLWLVMLLTAGLIVFHNFLNYTALKYISASVHGTFYKLRLVWAFLIGVFLTNESWHALTVVGVGLTVAAGMLLLWQKGERFSMKGIAFVVGSGLVNAIAFTLFKFLFGSFSVETLTFLTFFLPAIINTLVIPQFPARLKEFGSKQKWLLVILACSFGAFANLAINTAINLGEVTGVLVIVEVFLILVLAGEHLFLKERAGMLKKTAAVVLAIIGAICILIR